MPRPTKSTNSRPKKSSSGKVPFSDELMKRQGITTVYGPRKGGKTTLAASVSSHWKGLYKKAKKLITLEDMIWIGADKGATNCLKSAGYRVQCIDLRSRMMEGESIINAMEYAVSTVSGFEGWTVLDTVSTLHRMLQKFYAPNFEGWDLWRVLMVQHQKIHDELAARCPKLIYLMHAKAVVEAENTVKHPNAKEKQRRIQTASRAPGGARIVPQMDGQSADIYLNDSDHIFALLAHTKQQSQGKPPIVERYLATGPNRDEWEAGSRFSLILNPEEPADLGAVLRKSNQ